VEIAKILMSSQEPQDPDYRKKITIIAPAFNEAGNLQPFLSSVSNIAENLDAYSWEFIFVDDGSSDQTWKTIEKLSQADKRVKGIRLSRNFGKEISLTAGVVAAVETDAIIFMDSDLQHPPALIPEMVDCWEKGYQIVSAYRKSIEYSWVRKAGSKLFYYMLGRFSDLEIQPNATDFRLLDQDVLKVLRTFGERTRFFRGLIDWMGFEKTVVTFSAPERHSGDSSFSLRHLINFAINSFTVFSLWPLKVTSWLGLFVISSTLVVLLCMVITQFFLQAIYTPLAYFVVFNTLLFGVVLAALGMVALYIGHIHTEVVGRPLYIVQSRIGFEGE
jgi:polyisoprenyl-phosphate glycosyltransferase